jgi:parvulin-like peptidyl-prolyl isomerase
MNHKIRFPGTASVLTVALALIAVGCNRGAAPQSNGGTNSLPDTVASVNDRLISTRLFEMYLKNGRESLVLDPNTEPGRAKIDSLREGIVAELIDRTLIAQEGERRGFSISADKMTAAERRTIQQFGGNEKYDAYLTENRLTRDEYREVIKMEIYGEMMRAELDKGLVVSDDEVSKFYQEHQEDSDLQRPERVTAAHILIGARPNVISQRLASEKNLSGEALVAAAREEVERRRRLAEELRRKAVAGADFSSLARQSSEDPSSREQGGRLGTFTRNSHTRAFDDAAFALKPGGVSPVVQTDFGFHVIKVSAHEQARPMTLAEASSSIRQRLLSAKEAARLTEWLKDARRRAKIHVNEPFRVGALKSEFPN